MYGLVTAPWLLSTHIYTKCTAVYIGLQEVVEPNGTALTFRRTLTGIDLQEWQQLQVISNFVPSDQNDKLQYWNWESHGNFTVKSLYLFF